MKILRHLIKVPGVRRLWLKYPVGSVARRAEFDIWPRPNYAFGLYSAGRLARSLGLKRISAIEFGVAAGKGLRVMESLAQEIGQHFGIEIAVFGFDTGTGMPPPLDYRDLPYVWREGFYAMDVPALQSRLKTAQLVLGNVAQTIPEFLSRSEFAPIGFVSFDLDYYSSTKNAFRIFDGAAATRLPRVFCYFDDVNEPDYAYHNDYIGERCAIREFNEEHARQKLSQIPDLSWMRRVPAKWNEQIYVLHDFDHPQYGELVTPKDEKYRQLQID